MMNALQQALVFSGTALPNTPPPEEIGRRTSYHFVPYKQHRIADLVRKQLDLTDEREREEFDD